MEQLPNQEELMQSKLEEDAKEFSQLSEIIDDSNIEEADKIRITSFIQKSVFKGPLPPPEVLRQYDDVQPGLVDQIVKMAVDEQSHRHNMERMIVESETSVNSGQLEVIRASIKLKSRLQIFGFFTTFCLITIGSVSIFLNKNIQSLVAFVLAIASFCWTMFYGKKSPDKEVEENNSENE